MTKLLACCIAALWGISLLAAPPNLVVIMTDDMGYADVGFNGCTDIPTPHIDSIASNGVRFSSGYVAYSVCGPSRAAFITGRYGQRFGFERNPQYQTADPNMGLPQSERTIADALKTVGYRSGAIGKWHLGATPAHHPLKRGFDEFFGHLGGGHRYFPEELTMQDSYAAKDEAESYRTWILRNHEPVAPRSYLTDAFSDAAVDFVARNHRQPFFLYLAYNAPHAPLQATEKYLSRFAKIADLKRRTYAAMVSAVDDGVGRLLDTLRTHNVLDNTIVFFLSDNGGPVSKNGSRNDPLRGGKGDAWEGGFRVPFAVQWPAVFGKGVTYDQPVTSLDIFATIAAQSKAPQAPDRPLDGVDLTPYLTGKKQGSPHEGIFLRKFDQGVSAVRSGDHKLVRSGNSASLHDLSTDIGETRNIAESAPEVRQRLEALWERWNEPNIDPVFRGLIHSANWQKRAHTKADAKPKPAKKPNVLFIVSDDLNDYIQPLGGHPQARTPHIARLAESGVTFRQAHCNIPICNPSRASFMSGLYPHTSGCFGFEDWTKNEVLQNSRTMMAHFRAHGYHALGTGKMMHNRDRQEWDEYGHPSDYGPFGFDGTNEIPHPDTPKPFRDDFGIIDGSFGPLRSLAGTGLSWRTGGWKAKRDLRYQSETDRDPTGDELNAQWAVKRLNELAADPDAKPFFMGVGFLRPHTPLIVPQKYFDRFPLDSITLPDILPNDAADTFKHSIISTEDDRSGDRGVKIYNSLVASYGGNRELALRSFIQAYLASVAAVDDLLGEILAVVDNSPLKDNTIIVFTSDHGWGMGEKDYVYKNSLWQESTRVPLLIRAPGVAQAGGDCLLPVSLIDLYPTLIDLCGIPADTVKSDKGRPLDGHSLLPLLRNPQRKDWDGPKAVLTALYKWAKHYDAGSQNYTLRSKNWRYIRYENGKEELYDVAEDPHEWTNLALANSHSERLATFRSQLLARIPPPELNAHKNRKPAAKPQPGGRLKETGVFRQDGDSLVFIDATETRHYVIDVLADKVRPHLGKPVRVHANIKPGKSNNVSIMVYIHSIKPE